VKSVPAAPTSARSPNRAQAAAMYARVAELALAKGGRIAIDLFAGLGGIGLHLARAGAEVTAVEIDPVLAVRATENLGHAWPQASVVAADGFSFRPEQPADAIVVNAGVTHFSLAWLDSLAPENGRLLVPLTNAENWGGFLLVTRQNGGVRNYPARFVHHVGIIPCIGGRDPEAETRLKEALVKAPLTAVRSLRRAPEEPDASCWLAGDGWWLSNAPVSESSLAGSRDGQRPLKGI